MSPIIRHILGTDTDVGKTYVTTLLLNLALKRGLKPLPIKVVHSGWPSASLWGPDLEAHIHSLPKEIRPSDLCLYRPSAPVSPNSAMQAEGKKIELNELVAFAKSRKSLNSDCFFYEGVGGPACPLAPNLCYGDFLKAFAYPCVLVASVRLGTVGLTLLALHYLKSLGLCVQAIVLNESCQFPENDPAPATARFELQEQTRIPIVGPLPYGQIDVAMRILEQEIPSVFFT